MFCLYSIFKNDLTKVCFSLYLNFKSLDFVLNSSTFHYFIHEKCLSLFALTNKKFIKNILSKVFSK